MRRPIGWVDKDCEEGRRDVRVSFHADTLQWQFKTKDDEAWRRDMKPTAQNWADLEDKLLELKQRGHLFDREIALVRKLRQTLPKEQE